MLDCNFKNLITLIWFMDAYIGIKSLYPYEINTRILIGEPLS